MSDDIVVVECGHINADESCDGERHLCPDCEGKVTCEQMGPDLCQFEAAKHDRTEEIIELVRQEARHPMALIAEARRLSELADLIASRYGVR